MRPFIGIDIGGTKCAVTVAQVDGGIRFVWKKRFPSEAEKGFEHMFSLILGAVDAAIAENRLDKTGIEAIGVSCGGPLDSKSGTVLCPPNLPGWENIPLAKLLSDKYLVPCFIMNDANACALAEWKLGAGRGCENMIFLTMGTGMGGGVIAEGRLLAGASDMAGEIGHLRLSGDGPWGFGKNGSFEGWCSGGGIGRYARSVTEELTKAGRSPAWIRDGHAESEISAALIAEYAKRGDADAQSIYAQVGKMLGRGLSLLTDAFNPEKIVIGSIFQKSGDLLIPAMEEELKKECIPFSLSALKVVPALLTDTLGDSAAVMVALYNLGTDPFYRATETDEKVLFRYNRLFERYPALEGYKAQIMDAYILLRDCFEGGGKLFICGNGGSCADAEHIVGELVKGFYLKRPLPEFPQLQGGLPAISLNGHPALSSAFANDCDGEYVYAQQLAALGRKGDVLLGISTSGNARNVLRAAQTAGKLGIRTLALTGGTGGKLAECCDISVVAPANTPADVQEYHLPIYHALCAMLESHFFEE